MLGLGWIFPTLIIFLGFILIIIALIAIADNVFPGTKNDTYSRRRWFRQSSEEIGYEGEFWVKHVIGNTIENEKYVINNLTFENNGKTSQIDHVVINPRGIFVLETKNYSGRIYGLENQHEWTQYLADGKVVNKIYNPLKQNATHVYNVKKIVGNLPVRSLVVFVQNNTQNIEARNVTSLRGLNDILNYGNDVLSVEEMKTAYQSLLNAKSDVSTEEHIKNVKEQKFNLDRGYCPRCGNKLIVKTGKYGEFWGCSNYPKCKFIKNIHKY